MKPYTIACPPGAVPSATAANNCSRKEPHMLATNPATLAQYDRMRPTWKGIARVCDHLIVSTKSDGDGTRTFTSNGNWLRLHDMLPDAIREYRAKHRPDDSGNGIRECSISLPISAEAELSPAQPVTLRTKLGKPSMSGRDDRLILRTPTQDIAVNPRFARWVQQWGSDKGQWYAEPDFGKPLRYIAKDKLVGLLMPLTQADDGCGLFFNEETKRYHDSPPAPQATEPEPADEPTPEPDTTEPEPIEPETTEPEPPPTPEPAPQEEPEPAEPEPTTESVAQAIRDARAKANGHTTFTLRKRTKRYYRYDATPSAHIAIGTLYLHKTSGPPPEYITVQLAA